MLLLKPIINVLKPIKCTQFLNEYFQYVYLIKECHNKNVASMFKMVILIQILKSLHFLYMFVTSPQSDIDFLVHYDLPKLLISKNSFYLVAMGCSYQGAYNTYVLYFDEDAQVNSLLENVLINQKSSLFKKQDVYLKLKQFYLVILNTFYSSAMLSRT